MKLGKIFICINILVWPRIIYQNQNSVAVLNFASYLNITTWVLS